MMIAQDNMIAIVCCKNMLGILRPENDEATNCVKGQMVHLILEVESVSIFQFFDFLQT